MNRNNIFQSIKFTFMITFHNKDIHQKFFFITLKFIEITLFSFAEFQFKILTRRYFTPVSNELHNKKKTLISHSNRCQRWINFTNKQIRVAITLRSATIKKQTRKKKKKTVPPYTIKTTRNLQRLQAQN